jgi:hypothetical protein
VNQLLFRRLTLFQNQSRSKKVLWWALFKKQELKFGLVWARVSKGREGSLSLCPGTKIFFCLAVPGQGQEQKYRDKLLCPRTKSLSKKKKKRKRTFENRIGRYKTGKVSSKTGKDVLKQEIIEKE